MSTSGSRASSPSPPSSCGLVKTDSTTQLFAVPDYSKWARIPAGSALNFNMFYLRGCDYSHYTLKVYPAGLDKESAEFVAVFVHGPFDDRYSLSPSAAASVSVEILDATGRHVVFDNHTARSEQTMRHRGRSKGYVRFVSRRELEASCCVREDVDSLTVRCTISVDREVTWPLTMAPPPPDEVAAGAVTAVGSRTVKIGGFSRLRAALQSGECAYTPHFSLGGSSWYFKVYPNGHYDATKDCVAVFLGRGKSDDPVTMVEFSFELAADDHPVEDAGKEGPEFTRHRFDIDNPVHVSPYLVSSGDPAMAEQMVSDDRLVIRCRIRVIKVTAPSLIFPAAAAPTVTATPSEGSDGKSPTSSPGVVAETVTRRRVNQTELHCWPTCTKDN